MAQLSAEQHSCPTAGMLVRFWNLQHGFGGARTVRLERLCVCAGLNQASIIKDLMAYFVSDAVQQNLRNWTLMPLPKALATAAQQAVASMITIPSNQTRGGQAASTSAPQGDKPCDAM